MSAYHPDKDITLQEAQLTDAATIYQAIVAYREYLLPYLPFVAHLKSVQEEEAFLNAVLSVPYEERNLVFLIQWKGQFCGLIGFVMTDHLNHRTEIGYWLLPPFQKQGIMTRCVRYLCSWAIDKRQMNRIQIRCAVQNQPSNAIPQRLGFHLEGTEREGELLASGIYADLNVYSILKKEWISTSGNAEKSLLK